MRYFAITMTALFATALFTGSALAAGMGGENGSMDQKQGSSYEMEQQDQMSDQAGQQMDQQQVADTDLNQQQVRQIQQNLQDRGIDAGPVDGIMGPKTREGIREFQEEQGLATTGDPTEETLEYMGVSPAFGEEEQPQDMQQQEMQQEEGIGIEQQLEEMDQEELLEEGQEIER